MRFFRLFGLNFILIDTLSSGDGDCLLRSRPIGFLEQIGHCAINRHTREELPGGTASILISFTHRRPCLALLSYTRKGWRVRDRTSPYTSTEQAGFGMEKRFP